MSQSDTTPSSRPLLDPFTRAVLKVVGALQLTVFILALLVIILLWGMTVEKSYGDTAAKFGIYGSWWFNGLGALLALNATCSLILRLPWKRQHLGFILPHLGLVVLLIGCLLSRRYGVEATVAVAERQSKGEAYKSLSQHLELDGQQHFVLAVASDDPKAPEQKPIALPFTPGPFNWEDYQTTLNWFPWHVAHRDRGVIYDRDGIRLEVLDYLSKSRALEIPSLLVQATPLTAEGRPRTDEAKVVRAHVSTPDDWQESEAPAGIGYSERLKLKGNPRLLFWMTCSDEETAAFRQSKPDGPLGQLGRVVLRAKGLNYQWPLDDWKTGEHRPLGHSGLNAELLAVDRTLREVRLKIHGGPEPQLLQVSAESPAQKNQQDYADGVFAAYWFGPDSPAAKDGKEAANAPASQTAPPRIDLVQGSDQKIYMRTCRAGKVEISGPLNLEAGAVAFADTPDSLGLRFGDFQPAERPGVMVVPLAFDPNKEVPHLRQVLVQLTVDGQSEKFWLAGLSHDPMESSSLDIPNQQKVRMMSGKGRRVAISLEANWFPLGATIYLRNAWRKLDPGTMMPSYYASEIDLVPKLPADHPTGGKALAHEDLLVTLNAPLDFTDPASGLSYRMFQSGMNGPLDPERLGGEPGPPVYLSIFTINHDPGRGLTYLGCLLVVAGIFVAYFGKKITTSAP